MPDVVIISTGDELLYGTTVNTNSPFISSLFFGSNFNVRKHITTGDDLNSIISAIKESLELADIIITTGGLGPTDDDNTVEAVSVISGNGIIIDEESNRKTMDYFKSMGFKENRLDIKMSSVPAHSHVIQNRYGLAPGFITAINGKTVISLPGVPAETEKMMTSDVIPYLKERFSFRDNLKLTYRMSGIRESDINTMVSSLNLDRSLKIGITSKSGVCDLVITGLPDAEEFKNGTDSRIRNSFSRYLLQNGAESPEHELVILLRSKGLTISTAESCTGGLIAKRITDIPGSSDVFIGSVVAYHNDIKTGILGVSEDTLLRYGAVSETTAAEMASGIQRMFRTDISMSVTGIAGPGGGTDLKPVGTVCFGFRIKDYSRTFTKKISGNRDRVRIFSSLYAINFLRDFLKKTD